ncbi:uncharacterized protein LOC127478805 [Manacus candei]|nr:uncharacterized protein LOC127478805 [Manacus candei]XP_051660922.1 uncharacterized protein LOC127478805 [Manacus candei]
MVKTDFKLPFCLTTKDWELLGRQIWIAANSNDKAAIHANIAWTHIVTILEMQEKDSESQRESSTASLRGLREGGRSKSPREAGEEGNGDHDRQPWAGTPSYPPPSRSAHGGAAPPVPDTAGGFGTGQPQPPAQMGPGAATPIPGINIGAAPAPSRAPPPWPPVQQGEEKPPAVSSNGIPPRPPPPLPPRASETIPPLPNPDFPQPQPPTTITAWSNKGGGEFPTFNHAGPAARFPAFPTDAQQDRMTSSGPRPCPAPGTRQPLPCSSNSAPLLPTSCCNMQRNPQLTDSVSPTSYSVNPAVIDSATLNSQSLKAFNQFSPNNPFSNMSNNFNNSVFPSNPFVSSTGTDQTNDCNDIDDVDTPVNDVNLLQAYPVFYNPGSAPVWDPLSIPLLKDAKKAVTTYGLNSAYAMGILSSIFSGFILTPNDLKDIMRALLTKVQVSLFLDEWQALIRKYAHETSSTTRRPIKTTIQMLFGEGPYSANTDQARIPKQDLIATKNMAFLALQSVAEASETTPPFNNIVQRPDESFIDFAERLKGSIEKQIKVKEAQDALFLKLAISNSNAQCQQILRNLRDPTPMDMVKACKDISPNDKLADSLVQALASVSSQLVEANTQLGNQIAEATQQMVEKMTEVLAAALDHSKIICHNCKRAGHIKANCPQVQSPNSQKKTIRPGLCPRCKKEVHWAVHCRSLFDKHGNPLSPRPSHKTQNSGNGLTSA